MRKVMVSHMVWSAEAKRNVKQEKGEALFHHFGVDHEEFDGGPGNYTAAIVEWPDGQVELVPAFYIRFLEPPLPEPPKYHQTCFPPADTKCVIDERTLTKVSPAMIKELEDLLKTVSHNDLTRDSEDCALEAAIYILKRLV